MIHRDTVRQWARDADNFFRAWYWQHRCEKAERLLDKNLTPKEVGRAHHIADLEDKVDRLRAEIQKQNEAAAYRVEQLKGTKLLVLCTGCDAGYPGDMDDVTEETVRAAEIAAERIRTWWNNHRARVEREEANDEQRQEPLRDVRRHR